MESRKKKKILIVSRSFYPMKSPRSLRTTELVREFARNGHEVTLLTLRSEKYHTPFEKEYGIRIKDFGPLIFPEIRLDSKNKALRLLKRVLRRGLNLFLEYPDIELMFRVQKALKEEEGYDLLVSIAAPFPVHWGVAWARGKDHKIAETWIADCGDPYYGRENDSFKVPFYFAFVEKWFSRKADFISVPFDGAVAAYFEEFHSKIQVIPQGLTFPALPVNGTHSQNKVVTFAYFGNIASYLHYAVPFFKVLNATDKDFRFIVYTRRKDIFRKELDADTLKKCELRDYVDREALLRALSGADFLVYFPYKKGKQKSLKLVDYSYLKKPVLVYENDSISNERLERFLDKKFDDSFELEDVDKYRIENVYNQFMELL